MGIIRKQAISGTIYTYIGAILGFITSGLLFPKLLEPEQIGLLSLLISYSLIFSQFGSLGFNAAASRLFPFFRDKDNKHNGFTFLSFSVTIVGFFCALLGVWIFSLVALPEKLETSPLFAEYFWYLVPLIFFTMFFMLFDNYSKLLYNAVRGIFLKEFLIRLLVLIFIGLFYFSVITFQQFVGYYIFAFSVPAIILFLFLLKEKELSFRPKINFLTKELKRSLIEVSVFGILIGATGIVTINIDRIMIESLISENSLAAVGIYSTAFFFGTLIILPSRALTKISSTIIADAFKENDIETISSVYKKTAISQFVVGTLFFVGIWVNIDNVFIILSDKFIEGEFVIFFIALAYLSDMAIGSGNSILALSKHYKVQAVFMGIMSVLVIVTNLIFIPIYGIVGAAFASFLSKVVVNILRFAFLKWKYNLQPYNWKFLVVSIIGIFAYIIGYYIPESQNIVLNIVLKSIPTGLVFVILILATRCSEDVNAFALALARRFHILK